MNINTELLDKLSVCQWAAHVGLPDTVAKTCGSKTEIAIALEQDPDGFLQPPYLDPYETLCVYDHQHAASLVSSVNVEQVTEIARNAYLICWQHIAHPEICGLVSDDAHTLATLLLTDKQLTAFTLQRLQWYLAGRIPFGYDGNFPTGQWLIL